MMSTTEKLQNQEDKPNVFISYSRDDIEFTDQLNAILQLAGFETILDREHIKAGEDWQSRLGELIRIADTVVFVLSPSSAVSEVCQWELEEAERLCKRVLPVVCRPLEGANPPQLLAALNYIFFYPEPRKSGSGFAPALTELVSALNTDLSWLREHTRYLERATEWENGGRSKDRLLFGSDIADAKNWAGRRPKAAPELQPLHLEYIRASEQEASDRANAERQRLEEMAAAQAARQTALESAETALEEKQIAQQREAEASRQLVRRTRIGMIAALALAALSTAAGLFAYYNKQQAEEQRQLAVETQQKWKELASELQNEYLKILARSSVSEVLDSLAKPGQVEIIANTEQWQALISKPGKLFAAARDYQAGRIFVAGHDGFLLMDANQPREKQELLNRAFIWLAGSVERETVLVTEGHCEYKRMSDMALPADKLPMKAYRGELNDTVLKDIGVLVIGNAWGDLSPSEIEAVERFVKAGGGLMAVGLGWSWKDLSDKPDFACRGKNQGQDVKDMQTYPMNRLLQPFGLRWTENYF